MSISNILTEKYGMPVHTSAWYSVFVGSPINLPLKSSCYLIFNTVTGVLEGEQSGYAAAIANAQKLEEVLKEVMEEGKVVLDA